ncbi:hypothetical protein HUW51_06455 [Adhaeribacter swui]|uniref:Uncharacterized protein n=1 Tax=Adhaeribacter swui TaxID=2086471 RepID=A0A7G7G5F4_9BACT|nr:hypothetical protein [Adhaeribacter swui]QNF32388.1 hypothetical protein HUW51_06455 [Adhaeribacter swui]
MIKISLLLGMLLLGAPVLCTHALGQTKLKTDNTAIKKIPNDQKYQYNNFQPGLVTYNNGAMANAVLNYNFLLDEMQFINPGNDTLSLANEYLIKHVIVAQDTFYYQPKVGYLQLVASYKPVKLGVKQTIQMVQNEKQAAYDQSSAVSAIRQYSFYVDHNGQVKKLQAKGDVLLVKENTFYIIDQNHKVLPASKAAILTVFQKFKDQVNAYLKANKVNWKQEPDLKKLLEYCQGLTTS